MAVLLTWALFIGWAGVGAGVLAAGGFRGPLKTLLLAPTVGFATFVVPSFVLTRAGYPVRQFAVPLALVLFGCSAIVLWRARPSRAKARTVLRRAGPFAAILLAAFVGTAWPLFRFGFDWVANGNDDMASYCLGSSGFRDHGFVTPPTADELRSGTDDSQYLWFMHRYSDVRCGVELLLANTSSLTGLTTQQAYMPMIVALNLALIAGTAGLVLGSGRRRAALWAAALLAVSAANTYAIMQQVIAQVAGIALLCCTVALLGHRCRRLPTSVLARRAVATGLVFAAFAVCYPEAIPFLVGTAGVYGLVQLLRRRLERAQLGHAAVAAVLAVAVLPFYVLGAVGFLLMQMSHGAGTEHSALLAEIFPYFLTPRGSGTFLGLFSLTGRIAEPYQSVLIYTSMAFVACGIVLALAQAWRGRVFAATLVAMICAGALLARQQNGFGMFKLAMFAQPFLWAVVAYWLATRPSRLRFAGAACVVISLGVGNARTQLEYVRQSTGRDHRVGMPEVTNRRLMSDFRNGVARAKKERKVDRFVIASENNALIKLLETHTRGVPTSVVGMELHLATALAFGSEVRAGENGWRVTARLDELAAKERPWITEPGTGEPLHQLVHTPPNWRDVPADRVYLLSAAGLVSVFNRTHYPLRDSVAICAPMSEVRNYACFRDAKGARQCYHGMATPKEIALFEMEADPIARYRPMVGVGRVVVIEVLNPSPRVRMMAEWTTAFRADPRDHELSAVQVVGDRRAAFGAVGSGSARLVSPPLATQTVGASQFLMIDFRVPPGPNPNRLSGAESLWGANLPRDRRWITGHARDISVISDEEYAAFRPPEKIASFPADLIHPHIEYSGLSEGGWVGKESKVRLTQSVPGHEAVIRGMIPQVSAETSGFRTEMTVMVDGKPLEKRVMKPGDFEVRVPAGTTAGPRWIEIHFSADQVLPAPDGRSVTALIKFIGFEPKNEALSRPPEKLASFPTDMSHPKLEQSGIFMDGWTEKTAAAVLLQAAPDRDAVVRGQIPELAGNAAYETELTLLLDGVEVAKRTLKTGDFEVRVPGGKTAQARRLECRFSNTQVLPSPDGRAVGAHLRFVGFEPSQPAP